MKHPKIKIFFFANVIQVTCVMLHFTGILHGVKNLTAAASETCIYP